MVSRIVKYFDDDDDGYGRWLAEHSAGFVANMTRTKTPTYFMVHRASCKTITPGSSRNNEPGAFTARKYRKATAPDLGELTLWAEQAGFTEAAITACRVCMADASLPTGTGRLYPDEVTAGVGTHREGASRQVLVNTFERSAAARTACLRAHGTACAVCELEMGEYYGEVGEGFIHVHHLVELATVGEEYEVDPVEDLRPVCPNCHAMLHRSVPALSIDGLRGRLRQKTSAGWKAARSGSESVAALHRLLRDHERAKGLVDGRPFPDGGTDMLFPRLNRAAMNQLEAGAATSSRYGIWAVTCRDHIAAALEALDEGESRRATELLRLSANSLLAFAAVQAMVDPLHDG